MVDWLRPLEIVFLHNTLLAWIVAGLVFAATITALPLVRSFVGAKARKWDVAKVPDGIELVALLISKTSKLLIVVAALAFAAKMLEIPPRVDRFITVIVIITIWLQVGMWGVVSVRFLLDKQHAKGGRYDPMRAGSFEILLFIARLVIFAIVALLALDNLGVNITALLAGLGIGGIAIALAVQTVLSDLFASLSIMLDKPFEVGDSLKIDDLNGTVERIGIKSTRLRALSGEQIIISNADLLKARLHNNKRMHERRYVFSIGVVYDTPPAVLREIPAIIEKLVRSQEKTRFDRCHFNKFADSALLFETVYFVLTPDYQLFANIQQNINIGLLEEFERRGIEFAFPTQTQIVRNVGGPAEGASGAGPAGPAVGEAKQG